MNKLVILVHVMVSLFLIGVVLLQAGKGASIGATFGGGGGQTLFGSSQGSFIGKVTAAAAIIFMLTSLTLAYTSATSSRATIMENVETPAAPMEMPAEPAGAQKARTGEAAPAQ